MRLRIALHTSFLTTSNIRVLKCLTWNGTRHCEKQVRMQPYYTYKVTEIRSLSAKLIELGSINEYYSPLPPPMWGGSGTWHSTGPSTGKSSLAIYSSPNKNTHTHSCEWHAIQITRNKEIKNNTNIWHSTHDCGSSITYFERLHVCHLYLHKIITLWFSPLFTNSRSKNSSCLSFRTGSTFLVK